MTDQREQRFEGLGITQAELRPGTKVMVAVGQVSAIVNGGPCVIALAEVIRPATGSESAVFVDHFAVWWLDVYMVPGGEPLPQMYHADQILGIPALGLSMTATGGPHPAAPVTPLIEPDDILPNGAS